MWTFGKSLRYRVKNVCGDANRGVLELVHTPVSRVLTSSKTLETRVEIVKGSLRTTLQVNSLFLGHRCILRDHWFKWLLFFPAMISLLSEEKHGVQDEAGYSLNLVLCRWDWNWVGHCSDMTITTKKQRQTGPRSGRRDRMPYEKWLKKLGVFSLERKKKCVLAGLLHLNIQKAVLRRIY